LIKIRYKVFHRIIYSMSFKGLDRLWVSELVSQGFLAFYAVERVLASAFTDYQEVLIAETVPFGRCLIIDGKVQSSLFDEHIYHETLVHPALVTADRPVRVLIIGGAEGATAREVLKWKTVEHVMMAELDPKVVELCRKNLPEMSMGAFDDRRLRLVITEGRRFLESLEDGSLDLIVVDVTDPTEDSPSLKLYSQEFYRLAYRKLGDSGVLVTQATSIVHTPYAFRSILETLKTVFPYVTPLAAYIPSFSSLWGFVMGSKAMSCRSLKAEQVNSILLRQISGRLRFYSGETHGALVDLAERYLELSGEKHKIISDEDLITIP